MRIATRALILLWLAISVIESLAILIPAPTRFLLPLTVAGPELAPWFVVFNALMMVGAFFLWRPAAFGFAIGLVVCCIPLAQVAQVQRSLARQFSMQSEDVFFASLKGLHPPLIQPQVLPLNIHLFEAPQSGKPRPILIDIYGGAWQRGAPGDDASFARYMASQGFAVFAIDYRHAPVARYPAQIDDVRAAIAFIYQNSASYGADPTKIVLCGRSSGGQLALLAAYTSAIPVKAVIGFYAPTDLAGGYADLPSPDPLHVRSILETYLGGTPAQVAGNYQDASPLTYTKRPQPPTLLIQGERDHIVLPRFARELRQELAASGTPAYLVEIPWAEHAFDAVSFGPGNLLALRAVRGFLATVDLP